MFSDSAYETPDNDNKTEIDRSKAVKIERCTS
jgi:hypothetical protein